MIFRHIEIGMFQVTSEKINDFYLKVQKKIDIQNRTLMLGIII